MIFVRLFLHYLEERNIKIMNLFEELLWEQSMYFEESMLTFISKDCFISSILVPSKRLRNPTTHPQSYGETRCDGILEENNLKDKLFSQCMDIDMTFVKILLYNYFSQS